jgi:hypothetical protein
MSTVAPYDTLQLNYTAYDGAGQLLTNLGQATYSASDTNITVSPTGLVTAKYPTTTSFVVAKAQDTASNITQVDTAYIIVTKSTPSAPLASFSVQLPVSDSGILELSGLLTNGQKTLPRTATDNAGNVIAPSAYIVHFTSNVPITATVNGKTGVVKAVEPGKVWITASMTYYGKTLSDSVLLKIGWATAQSQVTINPDTGPGCNPIPDGSVCRANYNSNWIKTGGTIVFQPSGTRGIGMNDSIAMGVVFDDSVDVVPSPLDPSLTNAFTGSGNIAPYQVPASKITSIVLNPPNYNYKVKFKNCNVLPYACYVSRAFTKPGIYHFHSTKWPAIIGIIVVRDDPF